jgi:hypothetical protein
MSHFKLYKVKQGAIQFYMFNVRAKMKEQKEFSQMKLNSWWREGRKLHKTALSISYFMIL